MIDDAQTIGSREMRPSIFGARAPDAKHDYKGGKKQGRDHRVAEKIMLVL